MHTSKYCIPVLFDFCRILNNTVNSDICMFCLFVCFCLLHSREVGISDIETGTILIYNTHFSLPNQFPFHYNKKKLPSFHAKSRRGVRQYSWRRVCYISKIDQPYTVDKSVNLTDTVILHVNDDFERKHTWNLMFALE